MQRMPLMWLVERWLGKLIISERQKMGSTLGESESQEPLLIFGHQLLSLLKYAPNHKMIPSNVVTHCQ